MPSFADVHTRSAAVKRSYTSVLGYKLVKDTRPFPILIPHYLHPSRIDGLQSGTNTGDKVRSILYPFTTICACTRGRGGVTLVASGSLITRQYPY